SCHEPRDLPRHRHLERAGGNEHEREHAEERGERAVPVAAENAPGREQERVVQDDPDGGRACEQGAAARTAWRRGRNRGLNRYFLGTRSHRCRHATSCAVSAYAARTVSNERSSTSFDAFAANQSDVDLRRVDPASITRSNARASSSGEASRAISPFTP